MYFFYIFSNFRLYLCSLTYDWYLVVADGSAAILKKINDKNYSMSFLLWPRFAAILLYQFWKIIFSLKIKFLI